MIGAALPATGFDPPGRAARAYGSFSVSVRMEAGIFR